ncbi:type II secretion system protein [Ruminococcus sp.]|uniref:pilus assembly FimT family protein n=1 Tax=Ruminococcus sp. TaxID=41978 RepID=UPI0025EED7AF|nr:type II secretion system protein [Ruminococcus sp.]
MKTNKSKKGFTLMELIIVLAILGILLTIMIPTWGYFITKSRERNANSKAKIVFNAAQTEITRYAERERTMKSDDRFITDGKFYFYSHNGNGAKCNDKGVSSDSDNTKFAQDNNKLSRAINRIAGTEGSYKIYVENYIVKSVVYSNFESGRYKGTYPKTTDQLGSTELTGIRNGNVQDSNMSVMILD